MSNESPNLVLEFGFEDNNFFNLVSDFLTMKDKAIQFILTAPDVKILSQGPKNSPKYHIILYVFIFWGINEPPGENSHIQSR